MKSVEDFSNSPIYDYNQDSNKSFTNEDTIDSDYSSTLDFSVFFTFLSFISEIF